VQKAGLAMLTNVVKIQSGVEEHCLITCFMAISLYLFMVQAPQNSRNLDLDLQLVLVVMLKERKQVSNTVGVT
jgi:hypothetical protein